MAANTPYLSPEVATLLPDHISHEFWDRSAPTSWASNGAPTAGPSDTHLPPSAKSADRRAASGLPLKGGGPSTPTRSLPMACTRPYGVTALQRGARRVPGRPGVRLVTNVIDAELTS